jgi:hypothetical protein
MARRYSQITPNSKLRAISVTDVIASAVRTLVGDDQLPAAKTGTINSKSSFRYSPIASFSGTAFDVFWVFPVRSRHITLPPWMN